MKEFKPPVHHVLLCFITEWVKDLVRTRHENAQIEFEVEVRTGISRIGGPRDPDHTLLEHSEQVLPRERPSVLVILKKEHLVLLDA